MKIILKILVLIFIQIIFVNVIAQSIFDSMENQMCGADRKFYRETKMISKKISSRPIPKPPESKLCTSTGKFCRDVNWKTTSTSPTYLWYANVSCPAPTMNHCPDPSMSNCPNSPLSTMIWYSYCDKFTACKNKGKRIYWVETSGKDFESPSPKKIMDFLVKNWCFASLPT